MEDVGLVGWLVEVLPLSPLSEAIDYLESITLPYTGILNWFVPVGHILSILQVWLLAVTGYYLYSAVARHIGVIS